jgi:Dynein light chain type 1.
MLQVAGTELAKDDQDQAKKILFTYPMVKETDMNEDMRSEVLDICVNACEKHTSNNESAAKMIKELLDKKFGSSWHGGGG